MPAKVSDPHELFVHELRTALGMERQIIAMLPTMKREVHDPELSQAIERHLAETRTHAERLEQALQQLGEPGGATPSKALEGLELDHKTFAGQAADDITTDVLDLEAIGAAGRVEHLEIAAYESLISLSEAVGQAQLVPLLRSTLREEERMLATGAKISERIGRAPAGSTR
ncbi:MAG: YciE/YciF ferroxidase family protein [Gaiellales bacterium]